MCRCPWFRGRRHEDQRKRAAPKAGLERGGPAVGFVHDDRFSLPVALTEEGEETLGDILGTSRVAAGKNDDPNARAR